MLIVGVIKYCVNRPHSSLCDDVLRLSSLWARLGFSLVMVL
jgi:hypothetical protein